MCDVCESCGYLKAGEVLLKMVVKGWSRGCTIHSCVYSTWRFILMVDYVRVWIQNSSWTCLNSRVTLHIYKYTMYVYFNYSYNSQPRRKCWSWSQANEIVRRHTQWIKVWIVIFHGYIFNILCIYKVEYLFTYNWQVIILHFVDSVYFVNSRSINSLKSEQ